MTCEAGPVEDVGKDRDAGRDDRVDDLLAAGAGTLHLRKRNGGGPPAPPLFPFFRGFRVSERH